MRNEAVQKSLQMRVFPSKSPNGQAVALVAKNGNDTEASSPQVENDKMAVDDNVHDNVRTDSRAINEKAISPARNELGGAQMAAPNRQPQLAEEPPSVEKAARDLKRLLSSTLLKTDSPKGVSNDGSQQTAPIIEDDAESPVRNGSVGSGADDDAIQVEYDRRPQRSRQTSSNSAGSGDRNDGSVDNQGQTNLPGQEPNGGIAQGNTPSKRRSDFETEDPELASSIDPALAVSTAIVSPPSLRTASDLVPMDVVEVKSQSVTVTSEQQHQQIETTEKGEDNTAVAQKFGVEGMRALELKVELTMKAEQLRELQKQYMEDTRVLVEHQMQSQEHTKGINKLREAIDSLTTQLEGLRRQMMEQETQRHTIDNVVAFICERVARTNSQIQALKEELELKGGLLSDVPTSAAGEQRPFSLTQDQFNATSAPSLFKSPALQQQEGLRKPSAEGGKHFSLSFVRKYIGKEKPAAGKKDAGKKEDLHHETTMAAVGEDSMVPAANTTIGKDVTFSSQDIKSLSDTLSRALSKQAGPINLLAAVMPKATEQKESDLTSLATYLSSDTSAATSLAAGQPPEARSTKSPSKSSSSAAVAAKDENPRATSPAKSADREGEVKSFLAEAFAASENSGVVSTTTTSNNRVVKIEIKEREGPAEETGLQIVGGSREREHRQRDHSGASGVFGWKGSKSRDDGESGDRDRRRGWDDDAAGESADRSLKRVGAVDRTPPPSDRREGAKSLSISRHEHHSRPHSPAPPMSSERGGKDSGRVGASSICYHFNKTGECPRGESCRFLHICAMCREPHSFIRCDRKSHICMYFNRGNCIVDRCIRQHICMMCHKDHPLAGCDMLEFLRNDDERKDYTRFCLNWNASRGCRLDNCNRKHACLHCLGNHPTLDCPNALEKLIGFRDKSRNTFTFSSSATGANSTSATGRIEGSSRAAGGGYLTDSGRRHDAQSTHSHERTSSGRGYNTSTPHRSGRDGRFDDDFDDVPPSYGRSSTGGNLKQESGASRSSYDSAKKRRYEDYSYDDEPRNRDYYGQEPSGYYGNGGSSSGSRGVKKVRSDMYDDRREGSVGSGQGGYYASSSSKRPHDDLGSRASGSGSGGSGGGDKGTSSNGGIKYCNNFNRFGHCKFGSDCWYKHACHSCGSSSHPSADCDMWGR
ncbi:hypothetical protein HK102_002268 [Quaeritorhiza haematococci]|nr:hypothetical protein HK102_002268 [Quaeritorhiza haematococci]